jgi:sulfite reductase (NADPH) hemoprotein beta-component
MYRYDEHDRRLVEERARQFRGQVARRLSGELTEEEFRPLRLQNGLYIQLHAYMLRIAIPYGLLSARRSCASWPTSPGPTIGATATSRRGRTCSSTGCVSRTCPRSSTSSRASRCTPSRRAATASATSRAIRSPASRATRTSIRARTASSCGSTRRSTPSSRTCRGSSRSPSRDRSTIAPRSRSTTSASASSERRGGRRGLRGLGGWGPGPHPVLATKIRAFLPERDLLSYTEAILRIYNELGRRDNKYKARIKILVNEIGAEEFTRLVEEEWARVREDPALVLHPDEVARVARHFVPAPHEPSASTSTLEGLALGKDRTLARWLDANVVPHRVAGYAIAQISLKSEHLPPGTSPRRRWMPVADLADRYALGLVVVTRTGRTWSSRDVKVSGAARAATRSSCEQRTRHPERRQARQRRRWPAPAWTTATSRTRARSPWRMDGRSEAALRLEAEHEPGPELYAERVGLHQRVRPPPRRATSASSASTSSARSSTR